MKPLLSIAILFAVSSLYASQLQIGYNAGINAAKHDNYLKNEYKEHVKAMKRMTSDSSRYIEVSSFNGAVKGSCSRLTAEKINSKKYSFDYIDGFKQGCLSAFK